MCAPCAAHRLGCARRQASAATQDWNEHHFRRLVKVRDTLTLHLSKFDRTVARPSRSRKQLKHGGGGRPLRALVDEVESLRGRLARFRPRLAAQVIRKAQK